MPRVLIDFDDVDPELSFDPLPKGVYTATVDASQAQVKQGPNSRYIPIKLKVRGDDRAVTVYDNVMIEGKGRFKAGQILIAVGKRVRQGDRGVVFDTDWVHGKEVRVVLDVEPYEATRDDGTTETRYRNRVSRYLPPLREEPADEPREPAAAVY